MPFIGRMPVRTRQAWQDKVGFCGGDALDQPAGRLPPAQRAELRSVALRVKVSHDLTAAFAERYSPFPLQLIDEQMHDLVNFWLLLARYDLSEADLLLARGHFADEMAKRRYRCLYSRGSAGRAAAMEVVCEVLRDLQDLPSANAPDVRSAYQQLRNASLRQLDVVLAWRGR